MKKDCLQESVLRGGLEGVSGVLDCTWWNVYTLGLSPGLWVMAWGYAERPNSRHPGSGQSSQNVLEPRMPPAGLCAQAGASLPLRGSLWYCWAVCRSPAAGKSRVAGCVVLRGPVDSEVCLQAGCTCPDLRGRAEAGLAPWPFGNLLGQHQLLCQFLPEWQPT